MFGSNRMFNLKNLIQSFCEQNLKGVLVQKVKLCSVASVKSSISTELINKREHNSNENKCYYNKSKK